MRKILIIALVLLGVVAQAQSLVFSVSDTTSAKARLRGQSQQRTITQQADGKSYIVGLNKSVELFTSGTAVPISRTLTFTNSNGISITGGTQDLANNRTWNIGISAIDATKVGDGVVNNSEYSYLDGVSSNIQTQLDAKLNTSAAASTYLPFTGGTLTGSLVFQYGIRTGGTGNTDGNTFFGRNSFISRTSGVNNTALGANTLSSLTTGSNNVIIGNNTGASITTGSDNILIGNALGSSITTGSSNINIGGRLIFNTAGALQLPTYTTAGFLKNDGSGNITSDATAYLSTSTASSTYLPISNPTATGTATLPTIVNTLGANFATSSGNVGIGTSTPTSKFDVNGSIKNNSNADLATTSGGLFVGSSIGSGNASIEVGTGRTVTGTSFIDLGGDATNTDYGLRIMRSGFSSVLYHAGTGDFDISAINAGNLKFSTSNSERMRIDATGNVGIGTTSPNAKLDIYAGTNSSIGQFNSSVSARRGGNSYEFGHPNSSGYGSSIGANSGNGFSFIAFNAEAGTTTNTYKTRGILGRIITNDVNTNTLIFGRATNSNADNQSITNDLTINSSGNVGIGTTSPNQLLDVNGVSQANQFKLSALNTAPASATATGTTGEIRIDASFIYICTATNTWKRVAIATW